MSEEIVVTGHLDSGGGGAAALSFTYTNNAGTDSPP